MSPPSKGSALFLGLSKSYSLVKHQISNEVIISCWCEETQHLANAFVFKGHPWDITFRKRPFWTAIPSNPERLEKVPLSKMFGSVLQSRSDYLLV